MQHGAQSDQPPTHSGIAAFLICVCRGVSRARHRMTRFRVAISHPLTRSHSVREDRLVLFRFGWVIVDFGLITEIDRFRDNFRLTAGLYAASLLEHMF